jgi:hypothetical protein
MHGHKQWTAESTEELQYTNFVTLHHAVTSNAESNEIGYACFFLPNEMFPAQKPGSTLTRITARRATPGRRGPVAAAARS